MSIVGAPTGPARRGGTRVTSNFTLFPPGLSRFSGTTSWPHVASDATELTSGGHVIVVYFGVYFFACAPVGVGVPFASSVLRRVTTSAVTATIITSTAAPLISGRS